MILWVNGAFGCGKTSVADELHRVIGESFIYDPEQVGYFLWDNFPDSMKRKGNFQHMHIWRDFNYKILMHIYENYNGIIIVPMTIYTRQYYDEIIGNLVDSGVDIHHFILSATKQTIVDRLIQRGVGENSWEAQHIEKCLDAFERDIIEVKISTDNKSVREIAFEIIKEAGIPLLASS